MKAKDEMHKHYVCCDKCFNKGQKLKPEVEGRFALKPHNFLHDIMCKYLVTTIIKDFWNGVVYKMPLCCNIYFCKMVANKVSPAITADILRGVDTWGSWKLSEHEKDYIEKCKKGGEM